MLLYVAMDVMGMKKKIKNIILYSTALSMAFTCGVKLKQHSDQSLAFAENIYEYSTDFTDDDFLIVAHRGFSSLEVENTVDAITLASMADYVDCIEVDVRLTQDGEIVLSHGSSLLTNQSKSLVIEQEDYSTLRDYQYLPTAEPTLFNIKDALENDYSLFYFDRSHSLGSKTYNICSFQEGMNACSKKVFLDIKFDNNSSRFIDKLVDVLKDYPRDQFIIQSADLEALKLLQEKLPDFCYSAIIKKDTDFLLASSFDIMGIRKSLVNEALIDKLSREKKGIAIWTVNSPKEIQDTIKRLGSHYKDVYYITDYPDVVGYFLQEKEKTYMKKQ